MKVTDLIPDNRNARKATARGNKVIKQSLTDFGAGRSILIDREGRIIAGNKTAANAAAAGIEDVVIVPTDGTKIIAVQRTDLDLEQDPKAKALAIADNRAAEFAEWDPNVLAGFSTELDLKPFFTDAELRDLLPEHSAVQVSDDDAPEAPLEPKTRPGDLYVLGDHRLLCADATDPASLARLLDGAAVEFVFTDPPYGIAVQMNQSGTECKETILGDETTDVAVAAYHLCATLGVPMIFWGANHYAADARLPNAKCWLCWNKWSASEELSIYDVPIITSSNSWIVAPPTSMTLDSGAATALTNPDGTVTPRLLVGWNAPMDTLVTQIQIQYQLVGASSWTDSGLADVGNFQAYICPVVSGSAYNVRIRSQRANGAASAWLEVDNYTAGATASVFTYSGQSVAPAGTLVAQANSDGTAQISVLAFGFNYGGINLSITPSPTTLTGLNQSQLYYVYFVDSTFTSGTFTPVATQHTSDFAGKAGYFLIGSITTPSYSVRYQPTTYSDIGSQSTSNPTAAYDNNLTTDAVVSGTGSTNTTDGVHWTSTSYTGDCVWSGFAPVTTSASTTLNVVVSGTASAGGGATADLIVYLHGLPGGTVTLLSTGASFAEQNLTYTIPSGTNLGSLSIEGIARINPPSGSGGGGACQLDGWEIYIQ